MPYDVTHPASLLDARKLWPDATSITDETLTELLSASWSRLLPFVPFDQLLDDVPDPHDLFRWVQANVLDARELWTAYRRDPGDVVGFDTYAITVRPLTGTVRQLLRPQTGRPLVG